MKLVAPADLYVPAVGDDVKKGSIVDVPDEVGESLAAQGWTEPKKGAGKASDDSQGA